LGYIEFESFSANGLQMFTAFIIARSGQHAPAIGHVLARKLKANAARGAQYQDGVHGRLRLHNF
jgi:hypothetical protein